MYASTEKDGSDHSRFDVPVCTICKLPRKKRLNLHKLGHFWDIFFRKETNLSFDILRTFFKKFRKENQEFLETYLGEFT